MARTIVAVINCHSSLSSVAFAHSDRKIGITERCCYLIYSFNVKRAAVLSQIKRN